MLVAICTSAPCCNWMLLVEYFFSCCLIMGCASSLTLGLLYVLVICAVVLVVHSVSVIVGPYWPVYSLAPSVVQLDRIQNSSIDKRALKLSVTFLAADERTQDFRVGLLLSLCCLVLVFSGRSIVIHSCPNVATPTKVR
ncbi:hypothetical protein BJ138DRAFT_1144769 [Hygrophoropsis aurantiaca]|uniref:Uncharacterized protein n=1 Tax=Hygrophoropsis aurantiaca TaxID=72124 RepID=A0ACB8AKW8_9AGAM|nr:hypothetical protein BJ138DRAFT_1144769 [Hygrophoropsis aurantiaca]